MGVALGVLAQPGQMVCSPSSSPVCRGSHDSLPLTCLHVWGSEEMPPFPQKPPQPSPPASLVGAGKRRAPSGQSGRLKIGGPLREEGVEGGQESLGSQAQVTRAAAGSHGGTGEGDRVEGSRSPSRLRRLFGGLCRPDVTLGLVPRSLPTLWGEAIIPSTAPGLPWPPGSLQTLSLRISSSIFFLFCFDF